MHAEHLLIKGAHDLVIDLQVIAAGLETYDDVDSWEPV